MGKTQSETEPSILKSFAHALVTEVKDWRLEIPREFGNGYCAGFVFNEHIRMLILNYELNEELMIENPEININPKTILFKFQDIFPSAEILPAEKKQTLRPRVLIATTGLSTGTEIPIHSNVATINIEVDTDYLKGFFDLSKESPVLQGLLEHSKPLLFEQMIYPSLQKVVDEIVSERVDKIFMLFFLRVKAEELVCRLLMELEKRDTKQLYTLNSYDIAAIYKVKDEMLAHLEIPPVIQKLAAAAGMSPTKFKRLFKQIFGKSNFEYYQHFRMKEAAFLLKQQKLSVTAVGYQLGFTNLSHFSKVFQQHIGMKPKQYRQS